MHSETATAQRQSGTSGVAYASTNDCCHFWVIESPNGASSRGVCKFCNEEREFDNLLYHYSPQGKRNVIGNTFERPPRQIVGIHRFPLV